MYKNYEQRQDRSSRNYERRSEDTYESMSSTTYRSTMSPRVTNVQRSRPTGLNTTSGVSTRIYQSYISSGSQGNFGPGLSSLVNFPGVPLRRNSTGVNTAIVSINTARQRDKRDLENLNDKFAQYVEKVRYLEALNRKLVLEINALRNRSEQGSSRLKEMYDIEINEAHKLIDDTKREVTISNAKQEQAEQELNYQKKRYNQLSNSRETDRREIDLLQMQIAENEAQIALFRRRINDLDDESRRYKAESQRLSNEIARLQNEIQNELFIKSSCEVEKLALEDDLVSIKQLHEADLAELRSQSLINDLDPSLFFRNELSEAIREIRQEYETTIESRRNDLHNYYSLLINEYMIRTKQQDSNPLFNEQQRQQTERLRTDIVQRQNQNNYLRNKNEDMRNSIMNLKQKIQELRERDILDKTKSERDIDETRQRLDRIEQTYTEATAFRTSLEKEIATYRELLESPNGLRGCADRIVQNAEKQVLDRPNSNTYSFDKTRTTTTTIARTYINATDSNYAYRRSNLIPGDRSPVNQPTSSSSPYHTLSNIQRNIPIHDETSRYSPSRDSTPREYNFQHSPVRESSSRESTLRNSPVREFGSRASTQRNSPVRDSRTSSDESLINDNNENENYQSLEYQTNLDN